MTGQSSPIDPVAESGDAFAAEAARRLAFLNTPAGAPAGSSDVLRGSERVFDPMRLTVTNEAAQSGATTRDVAAVAGLDDAAPSLPDASMPPLGVNFETMTLEQVMQLMMGCMTEMMRRMASAATTQTHN